MSDEATPKKKKISRGEKIVRVFVFAPFKVPAGSMMPTLLVGDHFVINKLERTAQAPTVEAVYEKLALEGE